MRTDAREIGLSMTGDNVAKTIGLIKTNTCRVMAPQPPAGTERIARVELMPPRRNGDTYEWKAMPSFTTMRCRYGRPGDRLYVKQEYHHGLCPGDPDGAVAMFADAQTTVVKPGSREDARELTRSWTKRSSRFMPRWASRVLLEVVTISGKRLHDVTEDEARAEGVEPAVMIHASQDAAAVVEHLYLPAFAILWDSINSKRPGCSWKANPFIWSIRYKLLEVRGQR